MIRDHFQDKVNFGVTRLANMGPGREIISKFYVVEYHWFRSKLKPNNVEVKKI